MYRYNTNVNVKQILLKECLWREFSNSLEERLEDVMFIRENASLMSQNVSQSIYQIFRKRWLWKDAFRYTVRPYAVKTSHLTAPRIPAILPLRDSALETSYV